MSTWVPVADITGPPGPPGLDGADGADGVDGAQGPPGSPGPGAFYQVYNFATPTDVWEVAHGKGTFAIVVECFDPSGNPIEGTVTWPDVNTVVVYWFYPTAGEARLSA